MNKSGHNNKSSLIWGHIGPRKQLYISRIDTEVLLFYIIEGDDIVNYYNKLMLGLTYHI